MISRVLKSNQPFVIVLTILFGVGLWLYSFLEPVPMSIPSDELKMPFYVILSDFFSYKSFASIVFAFLLLLLQAFLLVQFNKKYILINYRTYLPAFFYILIASSFVQLQRLNPVGIGIIFIFIAIDFIYGTYRSEYTLSRLYLAGFFVSIASLFWAPFAALFLIIWVSLTILRPFIGREWVVSLLGFLTPYLFGFVYYFVFADSKLNVFLNAFSQSFDLLKQFHHLHYSYYIFYGFLLLVTLFASFNMIGRFQTKKIKTRKFFEINWWLFMLGTLIFILLKNVKYEIVFLLGIPLSYLLSDYFYSIKRSWYLNSILILLIASLIYIQIIAH